MQAAREGLHAGLSEIKAVTFALPKEVVAMLIGLPKEIKDNESRVGLTAGAVKG